MPVSLIIALDALRRTPMKSKTLSAVLALCLVLVLAQSALPQAASNRPRTVAMADPNAAAPGSLRESPARAALESLVPREGLKIQAPPGQGFRVKNQARQRLDRPLQPFAGGCLRLVAARFERARAPGKARVRQTEFWIS